MSEAALAPVYRELAGRIEMGESKYIPWIFEALASPEQARLLLVEDTVDIILLEIEHAAESFEMLHFCFRRFRLAMGPGHPGLEVFDAFIN